MLLFIRLHFHCWFHFFLCGVVTFFFWDVFLFDYIFICRTVQDQTQDYGAMLRKIVVSPTRRVLMASLTMFSCFNSSRYLSGLHGSAFYVQHSLMV